jgi:RNA polymerase sigma-70 factor, ECF subfamily
VTHDLTCGPVPEAVASEDSTDWLTLDEEAFRVFYSETAPALRRYARRVSGDVSTADDVLQESYLRLLQARVAAADASELRAYLFRIATNLLNDHFREERRRVQAGMRPETLAPGFERTNEVARTLERLKPRERQLLWLAYAEGSTHREIAAATGLHMSSIRTLLFRARRKLIALLGPRDSPTGAVR